METIFHYYVEVRDKEGKHFQDSAGNKMKEDFKHQTHELSVEGIEKHCTSLFNSYNDTWRTNNIFQYILKSFGFSAFCQFKKV